MERNMNSKKCDNENFINIKNKRTKTIKQSYNDKRKFFQINFLSQ